MKIFRPIFVALLFSGIFPGRLFAIADEDGPQIGDAPPPLTLTKTIQGPPATELSWAKLKGKVVVLEFWATWCGPCVASMPHLNDLVDLFKDRPVVFISVTSENEDAVQHFLKTHRVEAWVGLDDYEALNRAFHVRGIPHALIVDATGHIAAITHPAAIRPENLEEVLTGKRCSLPAPTVYTINRLPDEVAANQAPPLFEISIREHKMPPKIQGPICMWSSVTNGSEFKGNIATVESALNFVFDKTPSRVFVKCQLPAGFYDFELRTPPGHLTELQNQFVAALRATFGLEVKRTTEELNAYEMIQVSTNVPGLWRVEKSGGGGGTQGGFHFNGSSMKGIADSLETALGKPVFDDTHLNGFFYADMKWKMSEAEKRGEFKPDPDAVITAARERLGLQLTPVRRPVEILDVSQVSP